MKKFEKTWDSEVIEHKGFKDLGNYVIELPDFTDPASLEAGFAVGNAIADHVTLPVSACTTMAKRNKKGEVIIGRNMDGNISQSPVYVFKTTFGKYKNFCLSYSPALYLPYREVQKLDEIDPTMQCMMLLSACDCLNEKGLYIEVNLRERNEKLYSYGLHSGHGEETRADGTPWSELRAPTTAVCQLVSQNCATVQEAIEFLNNSYDWYTITPAPGSALAISQENQSYMIGDATGEYGLIEFAQDEFCYIPYQYGQSNYYITPKWNALDSYGAGLGRLAMIYKSITSVETPEEAMEAMVPTMWAKEEMWIGESERMADEKHLHPYNQIIFQDDEGKPQMDWRSEYVHFWPVMDDGRMLISAELYGEAEKSTCYDPKIKEYFDAAVATGRLVIDDGSYKFNVNGAQVNLTELSSKYNEYSLTDDLAKREELKPYYDEYWRILTNLNNLWVHNDYNFEAIKAAAYSRIHIRYDLDGKFDLNAMSKYEKLCAFYGKGVEKDEDPLRDDATIWTTSMNIGVNCAQKEIKVRFWENDKGILHVQF